MGCTVLKTPVRLQFVTIAVAILLLGGVLRFYKLGDWPFAGDETATLAEERGMFQGEPLSPDSQYYRLPRIIPLSYVFLHLGNTLFGSDEFGSRVILVILGTAILGAIFMLLDSLMGRPTAIATTLLVTLWPEHIFQSQQTRYYIVAAFFSFLCLLAGAFTLRWKPVLCSVLTCCLAVAASLSHTLMVVLFPLVFTGILAGSYAERRSVQKGVWLVFLIAGVLVASFFIFYLWPLIRGWNEGYAGYSIAHSVLASVNMVGWPIALLAAVGLLLMVHERTAQNWYWVTCALGWAVGTVVLPIFIGYHPSYVFPLALSAIVLAGSLIGVVYEHLRQRDFLVGAAWIGLICLMSLPSLASHYVDGSRTDTRTAAEYVKKNWIVGDRVTGFSMGLFRHYAKGYEPTIPLGYDDTISELKELTSGKGRLWIVVESTRGGLPEDLHHWLLTNSSLKLQVRRRRFDYPEYKVDVFLYTPAG